LAQLRDAHVPVLFRPYHEINGNWFWWGGRPGKDGSAALYRQLYDRFVNVHHLDNLVWVWNVNSPGGNAGPVEDYYPGSEFADVVTMDIYGEFKQEYYIGMLTLAAGKPIALAEVGALPTPEVLSKQPRWAYFMAWSGMLNTANTVDRLNTVYHAPIVINRDDPRLSAPMQAIRDATAKLTGDAPDAKPVTPGASAAAKALLTRLYAARGQGVLSGQENDPASPGTATASVLQATGKQPAIYATDLALDNTSGQSAADIRKAIVSQAIRAHAAKSIVSLSWRAAPPTDDQPVSSHGQLTGYEWDELLTQGSPLNIRWSAQVDEVAASLKELQNAGIAVLWDPYPEANGKDYWWAGRKGIRGSAELYRMLFDRLVNHHGLHNLVWVWEAAADFRPGGAGMISDFFPGLLYTDALGVRVSQMNGRFPVDRFLSQAATGKVIGVELAGDLPAPEAFAENSQWSWFIAAQPPPAADATARAEALRMLYGNPRIVSIMPVL
jgi:mannan endo-1,4-beta-mannosidase